MKISIIGGTGKEGAGLGFRWAVAGHEVILGSRDGGRAQAKADELRGLRPNLAISGADNLDATQQGEVVVLSVPYSGQEATLRELREALLGKLVVSVVVPLKPPKVAHVWQPDGGSAAEEAQALVDPSTRPSRIFPPPTCWLLSTRSTATC